MVKSILIVVLVIVMVVLAVFLGVPALASSRTNPDLFGMHINPITTGYFPNASGIGSVRLWDTHTTWRDVETSPGVYDWTNLDKAVDTARSNNASVMLVLSGTPSFYAQESWQPSIYGNGFCSPTNDLGAWKNYVSAVARRYKDKITSYEPVNEGDILSFYCGDTANLLAMSKAAYDSIKAVDPNAIVTSPSFVDRETVNQFVIMNYLKAGGCKFADAVSYHPYGMPNYGPERNAELVRVLLNKMHRAGCYKPVWSTEINYALPMGNAKPQVAVPLTTWQQSAYVSRTYLLQHDVGVQRVYWYDWGNAVFLGVKTYDGVHTLAPADAFATIRWWMRGQVQPCTQDRHHTWTCKIKYAGRDGYVRWNPNGYHSPALPGKVLTKRNMYGTIVPLTKRVGVAPVLYR
jgi:hypothetical protein